MDVYKIENILETSKLDPTNNAQSSQSNGTPIKRVAKSPDKKIRTKSQLLEQNMDFLEEKVKELNKEVSNLKSQNLNLNKELDKVIKDYQLLKRYNDTLKEYVEEFQKRDMELKIDD